MNKEIEEAIDNLEDLLYHSGKYEYAENCDKYDKSIETVLNYIKDSTPNLVIREKIEQLKNTKTQLLVEHMRQAQIRILQEISKKGEVK